MPDLPNYIQPVFDRVKQRTEAYQFNVEGDISSLETALMKYIRSMCAQIIERLHKARRDVSGPGECKSPQRTPSRI